MNENKVKKENRADALAILAVFFFAFCFHGAIEFRYVDLFGFDGYYHIKIAELYWTGDCSIFGGDFRWARFSSYNLTRHDWQLGYHLALIPFSWFGLMLGAKLSVAFFAALLSTVLYGLLRRERVRGAFWITLIFLACSYHNIWRIHLARPTTLFLCFYLLTAYAASKNHVLGTFLGTLVSLWIYNVPHSLLALAGISVALVSWREGRIAWRLLASFILGLILAIIGHPGFWHWQGSFFAFKHGTFVLWEQLSGTLLASQNGNQVLVNGASFPIASPAEFEDLDGRMMKEIFALPLALLGLVCLLPVVRKVTVSLLCQICLSVALLFLWLFLDSSRFSEYWVPFLFVGGGIVVSQWLDEYISGLTDNDCSLYKYSVLLEYALIAVQVISLWLYNNLYLIYLALILMTLRYFGYGLRKGFAAGFRFHWVIVWVFLVGALMAVGVKGISNVHFSIAKWPGEQHHAYKYKNALGWLKNDSKEGDLVFHTSWDDFAPMFFFNHKNHYLVSFDSYFFYQYDPELYSQWVSASYGVVGKSQTRQVLELMDAKYVFTLREPRWKKFIVTMRSMEGFEFVYSDRAAIIFRKK
jgi:hypothetical protein